MALKNLLESLKAYSWAHTPTVALIIGSFIFWLELYVIRLPYGHASWSAWLILISYLLFLGFKQFPQIIKTIDSYKKLWASQCLLNQIVLLLIALLAVSYLLIGLYAALLPPHLIQETDALNYHITLPRQHLILHSFAHLPWSTADLFLLPLDYALAPFELSTPWPNKLIQYFFFIASLGCVFQLVYGYSHSRLRAAMAVLGLMACHMIAIQTGTAMLDLVMLYCFLAFVHSFLTGRFILAAIECSFFVWSKPLIPLQIFFIVLILVAIIFIAHRLGFSMCELLKVNARQWKRFYVAFLVSSVFIASPHLIKSFYYSGTPIYLLGVGILPPVAAYPTEYWQVLVQRAGEFLTLKDSYGHGRSFLDFLKHFWLIAVPEKDVNNAFDYPVGLVYLLVLCPFLWYLGSSLRSKKLPVLSLVAVLWWITWWFSSQQTRFLLIPLVLMIIVAVSFMPKITKIFIVLVCMALSLEVISLVRAHRSDWFKPSIEVLRGKDREMLNLDPNQKVLKLTFPDAAFSPIPIEVCSSSSLFVIPHQSIICSP